MDASFLGRGSELPLKPLQTQCSFHGSWMSGARDPPAGLCFLNPPSNSSEVPLVPQTPAASSGGIRDVQETLGPSNDAPEKLQESFTWNIPQGMGDSCRFSCSGKGAQFSSRTLHMGAREQLLKGVLESWNIQTWKGPTRIPALHRTPQKSRKSGFHGEAVKMRVWGRMDALSDRDTAGIADLIGLSQLQGFFSSVFSSAAVFGVGMWPCPSIPGNPFLVGIVPAEVFLGQRGDLEQVWDKSLPSRVFQPHPLLPFPPLH